ncbi:MAG TPA: ABC transporter ATP-binding protein [Gaiellaceae bacterium]|nr:ABC transporter ATP-binding protein [Gaiellaceae bacterium]
MSTAVAMDERTLGATLTVDDLKVTFANKRQRVEAVRGVTFGIAPGRTLALLGESGSGKSASARAIMHLDNRGVELGGQVRLGDTIVSALSESELQKVRGGLIAMVPQDPTASLDPLRRVGAQIVEVLRVHGIETNRRAARDSAMNLLSRVGIPDPSRVMRAFPHELSGGMRQRAAIAVAVACRPTVLIADEPTTALDVTVQAQVLELFSELQAEVGMSIIMVTHDVGVAREIADYVAVMYAGRLVEIGSVDDVLERPAHPYTAALVDSVPTPETKRGELHVIPGRPPGPGDTPQTGCDFAPRCKFAIASCMTMPPPLVPVGTGHLAACPVVDGLVPAELAGVAV